MPSNSTTETTPTRETIGIAHLPNLKHKVFLSTPNYFNIIVAGSNGSGKTAFLEALKLQPTHSYNHKDSSSTHSYNHKDNTVKKIYSKDMKTLKSKSTEPFHLLTFNENKYKIIENKSSFYIQTIEIDGVGDSVNNEEVVIPILNFINKRNEVFHENELSESVEEREDCRIHAFLYFFNASSPRKIDLEIMARISKKVNLIPCCAKADILMEAEMERIEESEFYRKIESFCPIQFVMQPNRNYSYGRVSDVDTLREKLIKKYILQLKNKTEEFYASFKQKKLIKNLFLENNLHENSLHENEDIKFLKENLERL